MPYSALTLRHLESNDRVCKRSSFKRERKLQGRKAESLPTPNVDHSWLFKNNLPSDESKIYQTFPIEDVILGHIGNGLYPFTAHARCGFHRLVKTIALPNGDYVDNVGCEIRLKCIDRIGRFIIDTKFGAHKGAFEISLWFQTNAQMRMLGVAAQSLLMFRSRVIVPVMREKNPFLAQNLMKLYGTDSGMNEPALRSAVKLPDVANVKTVGCAIWTDLNSKLEVLAKARKGKIEAVEDDEELPPPAPPKVKSWTQTLLERIKECDEFVPEDGKYWHEEPVLRKPVIAETKWVRPVIEEPKRVKPVLVRSKKEENDFHGFMNGSRGKKVFVMPQQPAYEEEEEENDFHGFMRGSQSRRVFVMPRQLAHEEEEENDFHGFMRGSQSRRVFVGLKD